MFQGKRYLGPENPRTEERDLVALLDRIEALAQDD